MNEIESEKIDKELEVLTAEIIRKKRYFGRGNYYFNCVLCAHALLVDGESTIYCGKIDKQFSGSTKSLCCPQFVPCKQRYKNKKHFERGSDRLADELNRISRQNKCPFFREFTSSEEREKYIEEGVRTVQNFLRPEEVIGELIERVKKANGICRLVHRICIVNEGDECPTYNHFIKGKVEGGEKDE